MTNKKTFKVALIGCGVISANHLAALTKLENIELVALCDIKTERAEFRKNEYKLTSRIYADFKEMIEVEKPDSVHICTPHYLHCSMACYALEKNINVFLEKPMCINKEEIEKLLQAEKSSKAKITVCFQNRFNPVTLMAEKIANEDGGVITAYGSVFWERGGAYYTESGWRGSMKTEGGGVMINQAIHTIDLLCYYLGKPVSICATKANHHLKGIVDVEDMCEGVISFNTGKYANFYTTTAFRKRDCTEVCLITKNHEIIIRNPYLYVDGVSVDLEIPTEYVGKACYGAGHNTVIEDFYKAIENGTDVPVSLESAQYAIRILLAAYESCDNEIPV